jgi:hypothetical protein
VPCVLCLHLQRVHSNAMHGWAACSGGPAAQAGGALSSVPVCRARTSLATNAYQEAPIGTHALALLAWGAIDRRGPHCGDGAPSNADAQVAMWQYARSRGASFAKVVGGVTLCLLQWTAAVVEPPCTLHARTCFPMYICVPPTPRSHPTTLSEAGNNLYTQGAWGSRDIATHADRGHA